MILSELNRIGLLHPLLTVVLILASISCDSNNPIGNESPESIKKDSLLVEESEQDSLIEIPILTDTVPLICGSCAEGRDPGEISQYQYEMTVGTSKTDSISVRSDAACFEIAHCEHNILGKIKSGTVVYTTSSLKNSGGSAGIAYAFLVRDKNGDTCRVYMSYLNFEEGSEFWNHKVVKQ